MNRLIAIGCVLALGLVPTVAQDKKDKDKEKPNPAATKLDLSKHGRHQLFLKRNEESKHKGKVIFLGDSITEGWEGNQKTWQASFGEFEPVNLGISGDRTGGVLWRISDGKEIEKLEPKVAVMMIGTNNLGGNTPEQIAGGNKAIIEELKKQKPGIKVLLLGVFPRGSTGDADLSLEQLNKGLGPINEEMKKDKPDVKRVNALLRSLQQQPRTIPADKLNKRIGEINAIMAKFDDGKTVFYKDIGKDFLDENGGLSTAVMPDGLHLSGKGYEIWGKAIKDDLAKLVK